MIFFFLPHDSEPEFLILSNISWVLTVARCYARYFRVNQLSESSQHSHEAGAIMVPIVQMKKPRLGRLRNSPW